MITRRCSERRFFLRPDDITTAFIYCLALAVQRPKVEVNFACALTNHHHTCIHARAALTAAA